MAPDPKVAQVGDFLVWALPLQALPESTRKAMTDAFASGDTDRWIWWYPFERWLLYSGLDPSWHNVRISSSELRALLTRPTETAPSASQGNLGFIEKVLASVEQVLRAKISEYAEAGRDL